MGPDILTQGLTGIVLQLETAEAYLEENTEIERVRQPMRKALTLARGNLQEARRSVLDLRAAALEGRTLAEALASLTDELSEDEGPHIELETVDGARPLSPRIEVGLYRIAQEALANVIQHSEAGEWRGKFPDHQSPRYSLEIFYQDLSADRYS